MVGPRDAYASTPAHQYTSMPACRHTSIPAKDAKEKGGRRYAAAGGPLWETHSHSFSVQRESNPHSFNPKLNASPSYAMDTRRGPACLSKLGRAAAQTPGERAGSGSAAGTCRPGQGRRGAAGRAQPKGGGQLEAQRGEPPPRRELALARPAAPAGRAFLWQSSQEPLSKLAYMPGAQPPGPLAHK